MAGNTGKGHRAGAVKSRSQVFNPATNRWVKRDKETGKFVEGKADGTPFKGVRKEKISVRANPAVSRSVALKMDRAVRAYFEKRTAQK